MTVANHVANKRNAKTKNLAKKLTQHDRNYTFDSTARAPALVDTYENYRPYVRRFLREPNSGLRRNNIAVAKIAASRALRSEFIHDAMKAITAALNKARIPKNVQTKIVKDVRLYM